MLNQRPYVLSVFWLGVSNRLYSGEAENLSCRSHFQLQAFNSSTAGDRQERKDDGLEVEVAVLDNYTICPAAQALSCSCHFISSMAERV